MLAHEPVCFKEHGMRETGALDWSQGAVPDGGSEDRRREASLILLAISVEVVDRPCV